MINLAWHNEKRRTIKQISEEEAVSIKYIESIFATLKESKLIESRQGADGGYSLAYSPDKINLYQIIMSLEKQESIVSKSANDDPLKIILRSKLWYKVDNDLKEYLSQITLADVINKKIDLTV